MNGSELVLVNPRKRGRRKTRSAAQKRATRKLVASNKKRGRRRNPSPPGTRRKRSYRRKSNPRARIFSQRNIMEVSTAAAMGAAGAIGLDIALAYIPLPAMLKTGITGKLTKAAGAIALGAAAKMSGLAKDKTARDMTVGALTVQFTGIGRDLLAQFAPGIALSAYMNEDYEAALGYAGSGWNPANALNWANGMGAYNVGEGYDIAAPGGFQPGLEAYESEAFNW